MDFHSLTRKELQTLCKKNKIPANLTNVAMADALQALHLVEGIEDIENQAPKTLDSPVKSTNGFPEIPITGCQTSTRRKPTKENPILPETPAAMTAQKRAAVAASSRRKKEAQLEEDKENVPETPALTTTRKTTTAVASSRRKMENQLKEDKENVVQRAYSTRRSVRFSEKKSSELNVKEIERTESLKIDGLSEDVSKNLEATEEVIERIDELEVLPENGPTKINGLSEGTSEDFENFSDSNVILTENEVQKTKEAGKEKIDDSKILSSGKPNNFVENDEKADSEEFDDLITESDVVSIKNEVQENSGVTNESVVFSGEKIEMPIDYILEGKEGSTGVENLNGKSKSELKQHSNAESNMGFGEICNSESVDSDKMELGFSDFAHLADEESKSLENVINASESLENVIETEKLEGFTQCSVLGDLDMTRAPELSHNIQQDSDGKFTSENQAAFICKNSVTNASESLENVIETEKLEGFTQCSVLGDLDMTSAPEFSHILTSENGSELESLRNIIETEEEEKGETQYSGMTNMSELNLVEVHNGEKSVGKQSKSLQSIGNVKKFEVMDESQHSEITPRLNASLRQLKKMFKQKLVVKQSELIQNVTDVEKFDVTGEAQNSVLADLGITSSGKKTAVIQRMTHALEDNKENTGNIGKKADEKCKNTTAEVTIKSFNNASLRQLKKLFKEKLQMTDMNTKEVGKPRAALQTLSESHRVVDGKLGNKI